MKDKGFGDEGDRRHSSILFSMHDLLMVDISNAKPWLEVLWGKASNLVAAASERGKAKKCCDAHDETAGYTLMALIIETYGRLGGEPGKLLKDSDTRRLAQGCGRGVAPFHWTRKEISLSLIREDPKESILIA
jgi:hypothetical protein